MMHLQRAQVRSSSLLGGSLGCGNNRWVAAHLSSRMSESRKHWGRRCLRGGYGRGSGDKRLSNEGWVASHLSCGVSESGKARNWTRSDRGGGSCRRSRSGTSGVSESRESWDTTGTDSWSCGWRCLAWVVSAKSVSLKSRVRL